MNIFASIEFIQQFTFKKVKYYTIRFENKEYTEFEDFLNRMVNEKKYTDDFQNLFLWLQNIGDLYGAQEKFFRPEQNAQALPPPAQMQKLMSVGVEDLRLYCLRLNNSVVLLFNGGIKTKQLAQDCPNVSSCFRTANQLVIKINQLFQEKEIRWNNDYSDIIFNKELRIEI